MRVVLALSAWLFLTLAAVAPAQPQPGEEAIKDILTGVKGWSVLAEFTQSGTPSNNATKLAWQFYREGSKVRGRTTNMAPGYNCDFDIVVLEDGFEFSTRARWCTDVTDPVTTRLVHDPADKAYPFKNLDTPLKWWLAPQP